MIDNPTLLEIASNYPRDRGAIPTPSLELGRELLKAYYQCAGIAFTMVGWFIATLILIASCTPLGAHVLTTVALGATCCALTVSHLHKLCCQPIATLAYAGGRSEQFELRWKVAICLLGPVGLGLALLAMLRNRIVVHLEPYGVADGLTTFQEREVFVLLAMHQNKKLEPEISPN